MRTWLLKTSSAAAFLCAMGAGAHADVTVQIQQYLSQLGFEPGAADGVFGPRTEAALFGFYQTLDDTEYDGTLSRNELEDLADALGITLPGVSGEFSTIARAIPSTHFVADERVEEIFDGYERFINGHFDFPSLRIDASAFSTGTFVGDSKTDSDGYYLRTMIQYADYGDVDADGDNDLVMVGWRAGGSNEPARLHYLIFEDGVPVETEHMPLEGSSAVWLRDFDGDDSAEAIILGYLDSPVNPAPSYYINGAPTDAVRVGPEIDSHESNVVDFDGDGDLDVVAISYGGAFERVSVYENTGETFVHRFLELGVAITGSAVEYGDFDGDGRGELIVADASYPRDDAGLWRYVLSQSDSPFGVRVEEAVEIAPQYFSSDGFSGIRSFWDINYPHANARWLEGMRSHDIVVEAADIDLDGDLDLINSTSLWSDQTPMGVVQILINDGSGNFSDETADRLFNYQQSGEAAHTMHIVDVNGDTFPDIVLSDRELWDNDIASAGLAYDLSRITSGNKLLINDGTGHFVEVHQAVFSDFTVLEGWANSWFPVLNEDDTLTFVSLFRTPDGQRDLWQFARLREPLSTGPNFADPANMGVPDFNEFYVLRTSQPAREAVLSGAYESALDWFLHSEAEVRIHARSDLVSCRDYACGEAVDADEAQRALSHTEQLRIRLGLSEPTASSTQSTEPELSYTEQLRIRLQRQRN